jgi:hypothetical protein
VKDSKKQVLKKKSVHKKKSTNGFEDLSSEKGGDIFLLFSQKVHLKLRLGAVYRMHTWQHWDCADEDP